VPVVTGCRFARSPVASLVSNPKGDHPAPDHLSYREGLSGCRVLHRDSRCSQGTGIDTALRTADI
jgi:hypothetical protein